jgi:hypothetical protein
VTPPRIFGIPAARAPVVAIIARGPTSWTRLGRWDVERDEYRHGSWLAGAVYPQRCDVSPDGRWLAYFTLKPSSRWEAGRWEAGWTYIAISRLPWFTALAAWGTDGTWTRGVRFVEDRERWTVGEPDEGDVRPLRGRFGLEIRRAETFSVERDRGWTETEDTPARAEDEMWDEQRAPRVTLRKPNPREKDRRLLVGGRFAAFRDSRNYDPEVWYALEEGGDLRFLEDAQWADWDAFGRLLVATRQGRLQVRDPDGSRVRWELDLAGDDPDPQPPPNEARVW